MSKKIPKTVIDITGVELTPGEPSVCLGNGKQGYECCCDECDCFLLYFPEFDPNNPEKNTAMDSAWKDNSKNKYTKS